MGKEYIEKETLIKYLRDKQVALKNIDCINMAKDIGRIIRCIEQDEIPTTDVVEAIKCKECKHRSQLMGKAPFAFYACSHNKGLGDIVGEDDFCSYGERKE